MAVDRKEINKASMVTRLELPGIEKILDSKNRVRRGWNVDHIVPVWFCVANDIPIEESCSVENLQIMSVIDNCCNFSKYCKGEMIPEAWINMITEKTWIYSIPMISKSDPSLMCLCEYVGISYIRAISAFVKNWTDDVIVDGVLISRR